MAKTMSFASVARGIFYVCAVLSIATGSARAGLSDDERKLLDQPACIEMKTYSQDITLIQEAMQNARRNRSGRKMCDLAERAVILLGSALGYMRSHVGQCTITQAAIDQLRAQAQELETARRRGCN